MAVPTTVLNNGYKMPLLGLGTHKLQGEECEEIIKYAIEQGYRLFDTASLYGNEKEVGNAVREKIADGTVQREDLFITTKLSVRAHKEDQVVPACRESLKNLGLNYVDLFLIHSPMSLEGPDGNIKNMKPTNIDYVETWRGMEECKRQGLARSIGISNFNSEQITRLISTATIIPVNNQVEVNLCINQKSLISFCKNLNITVTGYSSLRNPLENPDNMNNYWPHPIVEKLSKKYKKTTAQILLRFVFEMGAAVIPKSANKLRIKENIDIFSFSLTTKEIHELESIGTGKRLVHVEWFKDSTYFPFNTPF